MGGELTVKKTTPKLGSIIVLLCLTLTLQANPRIWLYFSEFQVLEDDFRMELRLMSPETLNGWFLTSLTDTAYFKTGITGGDMIVVSQNDLINPLDFNPAGDVLQVHPGYYEEDWPAEELRFGEVYQSVVAAPNQAQSLCLLEYDNPFQMWTWYLDNTPTLGEWNDTSGARGYIEGTVSDSAGTPQSGVQVAHFINLVPNSETGNFDEVFEFVTTDENGFFRVEKIAQHVSLWYVVNDSTVDWWATVQVYPEDTVQVQLTLYDYVGLDPEPVKPAELFNLRSVYPNPFNSTTTVVYTLESSTWLEISVYDMKGRLADQVYSGNANAGRHTLHWNAGQLPAGVYFIYLQTPRGSVSQKLVYLK